MLDECVLGGSYEPITCDCQEAAGNVIGRNVLAARDLAKVLI
jgi:hypothetical protein